MSPTTGDRRPRVLSWLILAAVVAVVAWILAPGDGSASLLGRLSPTGSGCRIVGHIELTGRGTSEGVGIAVDGVAVAATDAEGAFDVRDVGEGTHSVVAAHPGYLSAASSGVLCSAGGEVAMAHVMLPGGDANDDAAVDVFDLVIVAGDYGLCEGEDAFDPRSDLNASGCTDMHDMVMMGTSYSSTGPVPWAADDAAQGASYATDVDPVLQAKCRVCHGDAGGLTLASYDTLMAGGVNGPAVVPGDAEASSLYRRVAGIDEPAMPPGGMRMEDEEIETIRSWIDEGAPDN